MRLLLPRWWTGSGLLAAVLTCGCQHNRCCCSGCQAPAAATTVAPAVASAPPAPAATAVASAPPAPAANDPAPSSTLGLRVVRTSAPIIHTAAKQGTADAVPDQAPSPSVAQSSQDVQTPAYPRFGHDPNYRWLVGTLDYCRIQRAWLLRYAPYEEDDRYGGCVTLVGTAPTMPFKAGEIVRVEGALIDPNSQQLRPAFQVQKVRAAGS